jgi:hypothetical protein
MHIQRLFDYPIITPDLDDSIGKNINGPSIIKVPDWVADPLGQYYLYFAHHQGTYIRLAYADQLSGPWRIYKPGVLHLGKAFANSHIASPDVHINAKNKEIRMYYHGCCMPTRPKQVTRLAISGNGLNFVANPEILGSSYWRAFSWKDYWYILEMPGVIRRSKTGLSEFDRGPQLFTPNMRHAAVYKYGDTLIVFYSNAHDCPECILWSQINLTKDWLSWEASPPRVLLTPETSYEGCDCKMEASQRGAIHQRVHQLRDPCIFEDAGKLYLLYTVAGESGIAIGELFVEK